MIQFLTTRGHEYTVKNLVRRKMLGATVPRCTVQNYDQFLRRKDVTCGVYIFTDMERLAPHELRLVAEAYNALAGDGRCRVLNNPARVMGRYELLRKLRQEGVNEFDVIRADECRWPSTYPVFIRYEHDHNRPLSTNLIHDRQELTVTLENTRAAGISLRGLLIVGYAAEAFDGPWFRKFNTFRVGSEVFAHHIVVEYSWVVKYGTDIKLPEEYKMYEQAFVKANWNADLLRRVFDVADIEYGKADWGIVADKMQVYEINTNPQISADGGPNPTRQATLAMSTKKFCESLAALEKCECEGRVRIGGKVLEDWRKGKAWYERAEKRP